MFKVVNKLTRYSFDDIISGILAILLIVVTIIANITVWVGIYGVCVLFNTIWWLKTMLLIVLCSFGLLVFAFSLLIVSDFIKEVLKRKY